MRIIFAKLFLDIGDVLHSMFSGLWPSLVWLTTLVLGFISPAWPPILGLCVLVAIDMRTGIKAARKRGEDVSSGGMRRTVEKASSYLYLIVAALLMEELFLKDAPVQIPLRYIASALCAAVEFKSISENVYAVTGVNLWSRVKDVLLPSKSKNTDE